MFSKVTLIGRREIKYDDPSIQEFEQKVVDFEKLEVYRKVQDVNVKVLTYLSGVEGIDQFIVFQ